MVTKIDLAIHFTSLHYNMTLLGTILVKKIYIRLFQLNSGLFITFYFFGGARVCKVICRFFFNKQQFFF